MIDDDIADDVNCVSRIIKEVGFKAWGPIQSCIDTEDIIKECFEQVLELDKFMNSERKTLKEIEPESSLTNNGTLVVELVNLMIDSIKSLDAGATRRNSLTINNYLVFNITGNEVKKLKIINSN